MATLTTNPRPHTLTPPRARCWHLLAFQRRAVLRAKRRARPVLACWTRDIPF
jgi:hypothetical protein